MRRAWRLLTPRGRLLFFAGLVVVLASLLVGQRDVMRLGFFIAALPVVAVVLVSRARLRMSCERSVEPAQVSLGSAMRGKLLLGQEGRLPAGILMLEDTVPPELGPQPRLLVDKADLSWRREVEYPLAGRVRGRFETGPLTVSTTDPFGLVRLDRQFVATSEVLVTPEIVPLAAMRSAGGGGSTGEAQPHRIGVVGHDDALVREYRYGDDVRRVHWRSTARRGEIMVRREEQSWDPSVSIILDSRSGAHAGSGIHSSLEWAVSAAASIGIHFLEDGFGVEIYEADGPLHISGTMGQHSSVSHQLVISRLTELTARSTSSMHYAAESSIDQPGQLVVSVMGRMSVTDANSLLRVRRNKAQGLALVLDVDSFAGVDGPQRQRDQHQLAIDVLRDNQWRVVEVSHPMTVASAWAGLDLLGAAA